MTDQPNQTRPTSRWFAIAIVFEAAGGFALGILLSVLAVQIWGRG